MEKVPYLLVQWHIGKPQNMKQYCSIDNQYLRVLAMEETPIGTVKYV